MPTMLDRRKFVFAIAANVVALPLVANAEELTKRFRVGILLPGAAEPILTSLNLAAFEKALRDNGWIEGENLIIERRYAEGQSERYHDLALDLVRQKVDVIVPAGGPSSLKAARDATTTIPIVMVASSRDPVADGLVKSFAHPGGNVTGIVTLPAEGGGKLLEILKEAVPTISRVGIVWDRTISPYRLSKQIDAAARALRMELIALEVSGPTDFDSAMAYAEKTHVGGLLVASTPMTGIYKNEIADVITRHRLPAIALFRGQAEAGLLITYGPSITDEFRRAATFVDKILRGAKPGDLAVEQPTKYELVINLKTAKALGITIPQSLLLRADDVIQ
jgi:putative ABC transport system substrate-binding protein